MNTNSLSNVHIYSKAENGHGIFYRREDFLVFFTMFSCMVRMHGLNVVAFCLMFNHFHVVFSANNPMKTVRLISSFEKRFSKEYNCEYQRSGRLFLTPAGLASKNTAKKLRSCIIYVFNNPVAGRICSKSIDYKWNLLAFHGNSNPFSDSLKKRAAGRTLRRSIDMVNSALKNGNHLNYTILSRIYNLLDETGRKQVTDYIISKYNFLNYTELSNIFGSMGRVLIAVDASAGSEYDLPEDYENYSHYKTLLSTMSRIGYSPNLRDILRMGGEERSALARQLHMMTLVPIKMIRKFLWL